MNLITINELSEYLKIKKSTLYSWASSGLIPSYKLNGVLRFEKDEIEEWIKKNKAKPFNPKQRIKLSNMQNKNIDIDGIVRRAISEVKKKRK